MATDKDLQVNAELDVGLGTSYIWITILQN